MADTNSQQYLGIHVAWLSLGVHFVSALHSFLLMKVPVHIQLQLMLHIAEITMRPVKYLARTDELIQRQSYFWKKACTRVALNQLLFLFSIHLFLPY